MKENFNKIVNYDTMDDFGKSVIPNNRQTEELRLSRRYTCYRLMASNTHHLLEALNRSIIKYRDWVSANHGLLAESIEMQITSVKVLGYLSRVNQETTQTFTQQEDIDLALEKLRDEIS